MGAQVAAFWRCAWFLLSLEYCVKHRFESVVKGHDFSRAEKAKNGGGL
jgi:hypothetical protein